VCVGVVVVSKKKVIDVRVLGEWKDSRYLRLIVQALVVEWGRVVSRIAEGLDALASMSRMMYLTEGGQAAPWARFVGRTLRHSGPRCPR
jgi:hypothetical protein